VLIYFSFITNYLVNVLCVYVCVSVCVCEDSVVYANFAIVLSFFLCLFVCLFLPLIDSQTEQHLYSEMFDPFHSFRFCLPSILHETDCCCYC